MPSVFFETELARYSAGQSDSGEIILKDGTPVDFDALIINLNIMEKALTSISRNSCCKSCQEAKLVAIDALSMVGK
jgi:hypothetical protein